MKNFLLLLITSYIVGSEGSNLRKNVKLGFDDDSQTTSPTLNPTYGGSDAGVGVASTNLSAFSSSSYHDSFQTVCQYTPQGRPALGITAFPYCDPLYAPHPQYIPDFVNYGYCLCNLRQTCDYRTCCSQSVKGSCNYETGTVYY